MDNLRGTGSTFSTSGKPWFPYRGNPKAAKRNGRLHRLIRAGIVKPMSKDEMRAACDQAVQQQPGHGLRKP